MKNTLRNLGRTGLQCSAIGFGCYRIDSRHPLHSISLERALLRGCNLMDTSTNYIDGGSELCVGDTLHRLFTNRKLKRGDVIVVSKVGYLQGESLVFAQEKEKNGTPIPEVIKYNESCWHCIHPDFIRDQVEKSLQRMRLDYIDVYLLHNPEYFFSKSKDRKEFYRRIEAAFMELESLVAQGKIHHYGVSSNTFGNRETEPEMTSVSKMWECAVRVSKDHHFSVLQLPMNIFESGPFLEKNNSGTTTLEFAQEKNLGVLVNRPLNAFSGNKLVRLADFGSLVVGEGIDSLRKSLAVLEEQFSKAFAPMIQVAENAVAPERFFQWATELGHPNVLRVPIEQWSQVQNEVIEPQIHYLVEELDKYFSTKNNPDWTEWQKQYVPVVTNLLKAIRVECSRNSQAASQQLTQRLNKYLPESLHHESLSRKSLAVIANVPGISCVLNGMRHPDYVDDALGVLNFPAFAVSAELFKQFSV